MKTLSACFIVLLLVSIGFGNRVFMTEAETCQAPLNRFVPGCSKDQCDTDCQGEYGSNAFGQCDDTNHCICFYPC
ncbi:hypothetical protein L6164_022758 [Bauhinia variegata]|uniref:Uncharacterized protein n=1 Tax=Bauhinia variegata TaxID=167791 RepID=A0ACB9MG37_BAUVA|nr:hypothetical protein L6164_022758 [Bauhinia variegata]